MLVSSSSQVTHHRVELDERDVNRALIEYIARNPTDDQRGLAYDAERMFKAHGSAPFTITEHEEETRDGLPGEMVRVVVVEFITAPTPPPAKEEKR